ncbi:solute carrier organic anion transporter family member 1A1-like [Tropilaelaps mercedesae]|uniref:Solute carrier organic anion transporter family member n=1 Tax=Tropilaelaps mercedesae TaxID=418985 RepID=A0A1V9XKH5_9ACAR|nr:solute carrier organic anion transporter family member 1A1-like [Tropilaelaps mercedesae]
MTASRSFKVAPGDLRERECLAHGECDSPNDFLCGVLSWRPTWLQRFVKPIYFTAVYLLFGIFQGAMKTGLNSSMTTIERKFGMSGKMISIVLIMDNITGTVASLAIGYYATKVSRPRILVFGVWLSILACMFFVSPHVLYGGVNTASKEEAVSQTGGRHEGVSKTATQHFTEFCNLQDKLSENNINYTLPEWGYKSVGGSRVKPASAQREGEAASVAIPVLILLSIGNMLNGIGGISFYIAGTTYTDDNVKKKNSPIYFAIIMSLRMLGPLLGVTVNSYFLTLYEHPLNPPSGTSARDPRWIGAWWLPFAVWGAVMAVVSLPLILFPKHIRRQAVDMRRQQDERQAAATGCARKSTPKSLGEKFKRDWEDFCLAIKRLSKNRVYMWKIVGFIFILNGLGGYLMNMPKYIENQYRVSPAKASFLTGSTKVLAMIVAMLVGGMVVRVLRPSARAVCLCGVFADFVNMAVLAAAIFLPCDGWRLSGTETAHDGHLLLETTCNRACQCNNRFQPFCDVNTSKSYFSPCFAGCIGNNLTNIDCSCLGGDFDPTSVLHKEESVSSIWNPANRFVSGFCPNDCNNLIIFIAITTAAKFISTLPRVGSMLVSLRCVDPADKALAIGFTSFLLNVLAAIPYPLIYGTIFDSACLVWGERSGRKGNCWYYENDILRRRFLGLTLFFYGIGTGAMVMMAYYAKDVGDIFKDDDEEEELPMKNKSRLHHLEQPCLHCDDEVNNMLDGGMCASLDAFPWIDDAVDNKGTRVASYN